MVRRCTMAEDEQGGMPHELSAVIQNMVRSRISQNWPRVRAHECRTQRASLQPGEWILAAGATAAQNKWVGLVKRVGVLPFHARQRDYLLPLSALPVLVHWYTEVQGTGHYRGVAYLRIGFLNRNTCLSGAAIKNRLYPFKNSRVPI